MSIVGSEQWMYASGEEVTQQSLKFNDDESQYLSWTPAAAGNRKTWTWSGWVKRGNLGATQGIFASDGTSDTTLFEMFFTGGDQLGAQGSSSTFFRTTQLFRDTSAWYHIVLKWDAANTNADLYVNGVEVTSWSTAPSPSNQDYGINNNVEHYIGSRDGGANPFDGYLSDVYFIDGQALDPTSFGQFTNGYWEKIDYAGSYGQNGFHLTFQDDVVSEGFNAVTYRGTGANQSISGLGFEPDFVWFKRRTADDHDLQDSVRGGGKTLMTNNTTTEANLSGFYGINSFDADGFSLVGNGGRTNESGGTYVAWAWDAGENNAPTGHSSVTYTGTGSTQSIKGFGFEPDLVWLKARSSSGYDHVLQDSVRGSTKQLYSNSTSAEVDDTDAVISFDSSGFTTGADVTTNNSGVNYVAWAWDAGSGSPVSNTDGTITSTVKANPAYGFSIVSYTGNGTAGSTIGHGLSSTPELIIAKNRDAAEPWPVYHADLGATKGIYLNDTAAPYTLSLYWNDTAPTSSVFSVGGWTGINASGQAHIAYCFNSVAGYSSIGSYTGNGSSSGPTINCGFRPGFVMIKRTDAGGAGWYIQDASRTPINPADKFLDAADTDAEATGVALDFTSTGFQIVNPDAGGNANGGTYIYMAFKGSYSDYVSDYNTDGTIDSRVKANPDYGFSITSYTGNGTSGATVGHGLTQAPEMVLIKQRTTAGHHWKSIMPPLGAGKALYLNLDIAEVSGQFNNTLPTSTVFTLDNDTNDNESAAEHIAYCFSSVAGYSSIGTYTGSGSAGKQVTGLGFKPAWLMIKSTTVSGSNWVIWDNTRSVVDPRDDALLANGSDAEFVNNSSFSVDFLSDGFELNSNYGDVNQSGATYIYMAFADTREAAFWKDVSGQGNHWTPNNLDYRDSLPDSPANNFATLSAVDRKAGGTLSEGNLGYNHNSSTYPIRSTFAANSGKWYWEVRASGNGSEQGLALAAGNLSGSYATYNFARISFFNGNKRIGSGSLTSYDIGGATTAGDVYGFAADLDNGDLTVYRNGTSLGSLHTWTPDGTYYAPHMDYSTTSSGVDIINFGQDSTFSGAKPMGAFTDDNSIGNFQYAPPAGYLALCTANLPTPTIIDGSTAFNTVLWTGNATFPRNISGVGFDLSTDGGLVWIRNRSIALSHTLWDSVRGAGANKELSSNNATAEGALGALGTTADYGYISSLTSDGFDVAEGATGFESYVNASGNAYVAWNWKAGGTAVSNTAGTITSQVSANTAAGFSVVSYSGSNSAETVGHGLGVAPDFVIIKQRTAAGNWVVAANVPNWTWSTDYLLLESTVAKATNGGSSLFTAAPTNSVLNLGGGSLTSTAGEDLIAYCFANTDTTKVGSYTGNGSSDGPFVYTGFRPAWVMVKNTSATGQWVIHDKERDIDNPTAADLFANASTAESSGNGIFIDFLSNGFKTRETSAVTNGNGNTFVYLAFAEHPFKYANAR